MRKILIFFCFVFCLLSTGAYAQYDANPHLSDLNGARIIGSTRGFDASVLRNNRALIMFWSSNCPPCLMEMRDFARIKSAAGNIPIIVIADAWGANEQRLLANPKSMGALILNVGSRFNSFLEQFGNPEGAIPYSILMGRDGNACIAHIGQMSANSMQSMLRECN